jgi:hypothetical protein
MVFYQGALGYSSTAAPLPLSVPAMRQRVPAHCTLVAIRKGVAVVSVPLWDTLRTPRSFNSQRRHRHRTRRRSGTVDRCSRYDQDSGAWLSNLVLISMDMSGSICVAWKVSSPASNVSTSADGSETTCLEACLSRTWATCVSRDGYMRGRGGSCVAVPGTRLQYIKMREQCRPERAENPDVDKCTGPSCSATRRLHASGNAFDTVR